jgi:hypothetical protein
MPESSTDKTKRKQIELLQSNDWAVQFSYFYPDYEDSRNILEDNKLIRQRIQRLNPDTAFFCKLRFYSMSSEAISNAPQDKARIPMPYLSVYATKHFSRAEIERFLPLKLTGALTVKNRRVEPRHIINAVKAIKRQKLYSTLKHLDSKANSYSVINKNLLQCN